MNAKWYLARPGGAAVGPLRTDVLVRRIREGTVSREALVWCQGMPKWLPLATVKEVADAVREESNAPAAAPKPQGGHDRAPATTRLPFQEDDADEKTELAIPAQMPIPDDAPGDVSPAARRPGYVTGLEGASPPSSGPTIVNPVKGQPGATVAILPGGGGPSGQYTESWAWQAANASPGSYELPDSATKIVNPKGAAVFKTLPAAGVPSSAISALAVSAAPAPARGRQALPAQADQEPMPTRIGAPIPHEASGSLAADSPAAALEVTADDELPPPYPPGFPGPEAKPPEPVLAQQAEPVELPMAKSNTLTRLAVAVVFILGLALGIFGARRVVMMRQAPDDKAADPH
jgi:hypothetical protein